jgi:hypothetical protein
VLNITSQCLPNMHLKFKGGTLKTFQELHTLLICYKHGLWSVQVRLYRNFTRLVRFEVFTAVTMKNAVFWDVAPCISCVNQCFRGTYRLHLHGRKIRERGTSMSCSQLLTLVPCWWIDGGDTFFWNIGSHDIYVAPHPRRRRSFTRLSPNKWQSRYHQWFKDILVRFPNRWQHHRLKQVTTWFTEIACWSILVFLYCVMTGVFLFWNNRISESFQSEF